MTLDRAVVEAALHLVHDPCSIASRSPVSLLDMGMVTSLEIDGNTVRLQLCPTNLGCTLVPSIMIAIEEKLAQVEGVASVAISIDTATCWTPDQMTPRGRSLLVSRRMEAGAELPIQPKQWMQPGQEEARHQRLEIKRRARQSALSGNGTAGP